MTNTTELREPLVKIPDEPDQTKYERDTLIWMLIDIIGEPKADLFAEAVAEIKKLKEARQSATRWQEQYRMQAKHVASLCEELATVRDGKDRLIESQRDVIRKLRSEEWEARNLVSELVSSEPCSLDHKGYCQEHLWVGKSECAHARAKRLLKPRCLECGCRLTDSDPPETDKCKSCYEDYER